MRSAKEMTTEAITVKSRKSLIVWALENAGKPKKDTLTLTCGKCGYVVENAEAYFLGVTLDEKGQLCRTFLPVKDYPCECDDGKIMFLGTSGIVVNIEEAKQ